MSETQTIADGSVVTLQYRLEIDGELADESTPDNPLVYLHGAQNIVPGLETELTGKAAGDTIDVTVEPESGYGEKLEGGSRTVARDNFPDDVDIEPGMPFAAEGPGGEPIPVWVTEVTDDSVTVDLNHPLAGQTLTFHVEVTEIRASTDEEREHGHPHGPGGHDH